MTTSPGDRWADWLIRGRFAGQSATERDRMLRELTETRDRVLAGAQLKTGHVVLDAGCGTGLLAFGALDLVGEAGSVIGVDVSSDALEELGRVARELGVEDRLQLPVGSVLELPLPDARVDAVVDRSVLIYVDDKQAAAREYFRVLRPGGRISIFEPINAEVRDDFGFDIEPMREPHERVESRKRGETERVCRSMVDFDAADLVKALEAVGFSSVRVESGQTEWSPASGEEWRHGLERAPNPLWPPTIELVRDALGPQAEGYLEF
ncbi:MAG: class I SAM-dependent methyltransferase [Candidatus Limnocylindria bacterium]